MSELDQDELVPVRDEMIELINTLHQKYQLVHGDIKPTHFVRSKDGKLRLCDFEEARPIHENPKKWRGRATWMYTSPNRNFQCTHAPPTVSDDLFTLGLCIWQLYTKRYPFPPEADRESVVMASLRKGSTVDVNEIDDPESRKIVSGYLLQGGAKLDKPWKANE